MNISKYGRMVRQATKMDKKYNIELQYPVGTVVMRKGSNPSVGFMWALQFISGDANPEAMSRISKEAGAFTATYWHSLMPNEQGIDPILEYLMVDPETKDAVILFKKRALVSPYHMPCIQFYTYKGRSLNAIVTMTTADASEEIPNTIIFASVLVKVLASLCHLAQGTITLHIGVVTHELPTSGSPYSDTWSFDGVPVLSSLADYKMWADEVVNNENLLELCGLFNVTKL